MQYDSAQQAQKTWLSNVIHFRFVFLFLFLSPSLAFSTENLGSDVWNVIVCPCESWMSLTVGWFNNLVVILFNFELNEAA